MLRSSRSLGIRSLTPLDTTTIIGEMAVSEVSINLAQAVQIYRFIFEQPAIPAEVVWNLRKKIDEKATFIVEYLSHTILKEVVDVLRDYPLREAYDESDQDEVTVTAIWWCVNHGGLDPNSL